MADDEGALFHHHEDWVLDDGSLIEDLPSDPNDCEGGGSGNSQAEKPWAVYFYPFLKSRVVAFCPMDGVTHPRALSTTILQYSGDAQGVGEECDVAPTSEACLSRKNNWAPWSYLLNSIFTHKSCRYAAESVLPCFATEGELSNLHDPNVIMFSERNSEGFSDPQSAFYFTLQDDYDTWGGEAALVRWGSGSRPNEGWIKYNRHGGGANYIYADAHVKWMPWSRARRDQYPDHVVRKPLAQPPQ